LAGGEEQEFFLVVSFLWRSLVCGLVLEYVHDGLLDGDTHKDKKFFTSHTIPDIALRFDIRNTQNSFLMKKLLFVLLSAASAAVLAGGPEKSVDYNGSVFFQILLQHNETPGCTVPGACNYEKSATLDNGSCVFNDCLADINMDGVVDKKDVDFLIDNWMELDLLTNPSAQDDDVFWEVWVEEVSFGQKASRQDITEGFISESKKNNVSRTENGNGSVLFIYEANAPGIHHIEARSKKTGKLIGYSVIVVDSKATLLQYRNSLDSPVYIQLNSFENAAWSPSTNHQYAGRYPLGLQ
jgi:hypothetical protein